MFKNMNQNKFKIVLIVLVVILLAVVVYFVFFNKQNRGNVMDYSVVYLATGEIYVGKLSTFPNLTLSNGYIFQVTKDATDPTKNNFGLNPFKDTFWGSKKLRINPEQVIFHGLVEKDSQIGKALAGQGK